MRTIHRMALWLLPPAALAMAAEMEEVFGYCLQVERARRPRLWPLWALRDIARTVAFALSLRRGAPRMPNRRKVVKALDFRSTLRMMRHRPMFAASVVLMLALGIGATTALFSVVDGVLLRPLPFPEPDRLVQVYGSAPARNITRTSLTAADAWDLVDMNRTFSTFGIWHGASFTMSDGTTAERVNGGLVSVGFFGALAPRPVAGRLFVEGEDRAGAPADVVLLSYGFWARRFGADAGVIGRKLSFGGQQKEVVGVLPPGTPWLDAADVFVPFPRRANMDRSSWEYAAVGRMKPGVSQAAATEDLQRIGRDLAATYAKSNGGLTFITASSNEWIATDTLRRTMWILLGATGLLLLIAVVNVTNLLLAHASSRVREAAVRAALGASQADLIRERLAESSVFSAGGAALGWVVAWVMLRVFKAMEPAGVPRLPFVDLDLRTLGFTILVAAVVAVLTGLVPALRAPIGHVVSAMRQSARGTVGDRGNDRLRHLLVAAQVALSLVLLVGAGLLVRSLNEVLRAERGFDTEQRLLATVSIPASYPEPRRTEIVQTILSRTEALPQVAAVAAVSSRPLSGGSTGLGFAPADRAIADAAVPWASWRIVSKDYFKAMGVPLLAGRNFTEQDIIEKPWRVIVSKRLADQIWPGENPVGKTAILWKGQSNTPGEVIGVVGNMRERGLENPPTLAVYFPVYGAMGVTTLQVVLHTRGTAESATPLLRDVVRGIDPSLPVSNVRTLEETVTRSVGMRRFTMTLLTTFAVIALVLSMAGVYGVLAYSIARRTAEMGVRLALGASPMQVLGRMFSRGMLPVGAGLAGGFVASFWTARFITSLLFEIRPRDPLTFGAVTAVLLATSALACYVPARQVLRVEPSVALRIE